MKPALVLALLLSTLTVTAQTTRTFRPEDLFDLRRVGATAWSQAGQASEVFALHRLQPRKRVGSVATD